MFELTKELLTYVLLALSAVLVVLLVLILRKRGLLGGHKKDAVPKPPAAETGPTDHDAIKETLKKEKGKDMLMPSPPPAPGKDGGKKMTFPKDEPKVPSGESPFPIEPGDEEGLGEELPEGEAEMGVDLEDMEEPVKSKQKKTWDTLRMADPAMRSEEAEHVGFVDLGEIKSGSEPAPLVKEAGKKGFMSKFGRKDAQKEKPGPSTERKKSDDSPPAKAVEMPAREGGESLSTADIMGSSGGFRGHTVEIEGDLKLSSRGADDCWYMLFDGKGSAVVRSKEHIPHSRARILAKVEQTRLGQVYLEVISYEQA